MSGVSEPDAALFRRAMGRFATGVVVTSCIVRGVDHAMTANAFVSVSLEPLLVLVCVENEARYHEAVVEAGAWGVSVLCAHSRGAAQWLSTQGRPLHGQLEPVRHFPGPLTGAALLHGALATLECRTTAVHPGGDHSIVVGEVLDVCLADDPGAALLYYRGAYETVS